MPAADVCPLDRRTTKTNLVARWVCNQKCLISSARAAPKYLHLKNAIKQCFDLREQLHSLGGAGV